MSDLMLNCDFITLCTSKGDIGTSDTCHHWRVISVDCYTWDLHKLPFATSLAFPMMALLFINSVLFTVSDSEVLNCWHEHALPWCLIIVVALNDRRRYLIGCNISSYVFVCWSNRVTAISSFCLSAVSYICEADINTMIIVPFMGLFQCSGIRRFSLTGLVV